MTGKKQEKQPMEIEVEIIPLRREDDPVLYARQKEYFARLAEAAVAAVERKEAERDAQNNADKTKTEDD
jgi:hypothetical protein